MKFLFIFFSFFFWTMTSLMIYSKSEYPKKLIITVPVADLRAKPQANSIDLQLPTSDIDNSLQISQILLGEHILAHQEIVDQAGVCWLRINTLQQEYYYEPLLWHGYPGWIQKNQTKSVNLYPHHNLVTCKHNATIFNKEQIIVNRLSIGTRLCGITKKCDSLWQILLPDNTIAYINDSDVYYLDPTVQESTERLRASIVATAKTFLDFWYSWGGRSTQNNGHISSVDCSALVGLSFLSNGLQLPRMSHEQWMQSYKIQDGADLQPGDLIFLTTLTKQATRMDHVMLYAGPNLLLEATYAGERKTRFIHFDQRLGKRPELLQSGDIVEIEHDIFQIYFGTFLHDQEQIQTLRNHALRTEYDPTFINKKNFFEDLNYLRFH